MMFKHNYRWLLIVMRGVFFLALLSVVLVVYGSVPFFASPTLGQTLWSAGFSKSFISESIFNIYARNFGAPTPAAIAFGLSGAWPTGLLMKVGLSAVDAYTVMVATWLSVAFFSAFKICRYFSISYKASVWGALAWGTMPVIWGHSGFSMLSLGFALFPFYMLSSFKLFSWSSEGRVSIYSWVMRAVFCLLACLVSVFMDGYSFVMFAVAGTVLGGVGFIRNRHLRRWYLKFSFPIHFICFATAYILYIYYVGRTDFDSDSLDWIRAEGVDIAFLLIPEKGVSWVMDGLGLSVYRPNGAFWGIPSVRDTTFILPIVTGALFSVFRMRRVSRYTLSFLLCLVFSTYMALGPSLKVNSTRPSSQAPLMEMPASFALCRTGSEFLTQNIPGFKNMRFCYRWIALAAFCAWVLILLLPVSGMGRNGFVTCLIFVVVTIFNLPNVPERIRVCRSYRMKFFEIDNSYVEDMAKVTKEGEVVAFLPWGNDFLVNYLAARLKIITYNVGGDKNLSTARSHWPKGMRGFSERQIDPGFSNRVIRLLMAGEADRVILPYVDMGAAAYQWPCPLSLKENLAPVMDRLKKCDALRVVEGKYYVSIELNRASASQS